MKRLYFLFGAVFAFYVCVNIPSLGNWPMLCHDSANTNRATGDIVFPPFVEYWRYSVSKSIYIEHLIASNGVLLISESNAINRIEALSTLTGKPLWSFDIEGTHGAPGFCPAIWEHLAYVSGQGATTLFALNLQTGEIKWKFSPPSIDFGGFYEGHPRILKNTLYFTVNVSLKYKELLKLLRSGAHIPSHPRSKLYALDTKTGEEKWSIVLNGLSWEQVPCVIDDLVLAYEQSDWGDKLPYGWESSDFGDLVAIDALTGMEVWRKKMFATVFNRPLVSGNIVVSLAARKPCVVRTMSLDGQLLWDYTITGMAFPGFAVTSGKIFWSLWDEEQNNGYIIAINLNTGKELWRRRIENGYPSPPTVVGKILLVATPSKLMALHVDTGELLWTSSEFLSKWLRPCQPIVAGELIFAALGNTVLSFGPATRRK